MNKLEAAFAPEASPDTAGYDDVTEDSDEDEKEEEEAEERRKVRYDIRGGGHWLLFFYFFKNVFTATTVHVKGDMLYHLL